MITNETKVRVCREKRSPGSREWGTNPFTWYLDTNIGNLREVLGLRHRDAVERVKNELPTERVVFLYCGDVRYSVEVVS